MKNITLSIYACALILVSTAASWATTNYYVDAGNGAPQSPYTNWATASTNIQSVLSLVGNADTVRVATATYTGNFTLSKSTTLWGGYPAGGGARDVDANPTTLTAASGTIIEMAANNSCLDGFIVDGQNKSASICVYINASAGMTVMRNEVKDAADVGVDRSGTLTGMLIASNRVHDCGTGYPDAGIRLRNSDNSTGALRNNTVWGTHCGISLEWATGLTFDFVNNVVYDNAWGVLQGSGPGFAIKNSIFWSNTITFYQCSIPRQYCNIQNGAMGEPGNIDIDPKFVGGDPFSFELSAVSPCIDAGTNVGLTSAGTAPDMGYKESAHTNELFAITYVDDANGNDTYDGAAATWQGGIVGPKKTLQSGINATAIDGVCYVTNGTYSENIYLKRGTLQNIAGATPVITAAAGTIVHASSCATIDGFTIDGQNIVENGIYLPTTTNVTIQRNTIKDIAEKGIGSWQVAHASMVIQYNWIDNCGAGGSVRHGAISLYECSSSTIIVRNNVISGSDRLALGLEHHSPTVLCINNTVHNNYYGVLQGSTNLTIENCIFWDNTGELYQVGTTEVRFNDVQGGYSGRANIDADPLFVTPGTNYQLQSNSPCINPGNGYTEMGRYGRPGLAINGEYPASYTTNAIVTLTVSTNTPTWTNDAVKMRFSNNGSVWSPAEAIPGSCNKAWNITNATYGGNNAQGFKTVYYQPCNGDGSPVLRIGGGTTVVSSTIEYLVQKTVTNARLQRAYYTIQDGMEDGDIQSGDVIEMISSDTYCENVTIPSGITLRPAAGCTPTITAWDGTVVSCTTGATVDGCIIDGQSNNATIGILISGSSDISVLNNVVRNISSYGIYRTGTFGDTVVVAYNTAYDCSSGIRLFNSDNASGVVKNNILYRNSRGLDLEWCENLTLTCVNNTVYSNAYAQMQGNGASFIVKNSIYWGNTAQNTPYQTTPTLEHCNVQGGYAGDGNIDSDPLFVSTVQGSEDFHLKSEAGTKVGGTNWTIFATNSLCIDAGDPESEYADEPLPNGKRINMGCYGNTTEASRSVVERPGTVFIIR